MNPMLTQPMAAGQISSRVPIGPKEVAFWFWEITGYLEDHPS